MASNEIEPGSDEYGTEGIKAAKAGPIAANLGSYQAMSKVLSLLGIDLQSEHFAKTPERFVKYLTHYLQPYDPEYDLGKSFQTEEDFHAMVVESDIPFTAICAHHLVPFTGVAHIGYIPRGRVVGLSKLVRVIDGIAHRSPSVQEEIGDDTADAIMRYLKPSGVIVVIQAVHGCMACRGISKPNIITSTSSVRGAFRDVAQARNEFFQLIRPR